MNFTFFDSLVISSTLLMFLLAEYIAENSQR